MSMARSSPVVRHQNQGVVFSDSGVKLQLFCHDSNVGNGKFHVRGLFASVNQVGQGFGIAPNPQNSLDNANTKVLAATLQMKYVSMPEPTLPVERIPELVIGEVLEVKEEEEQKSKKKTKGGFRWKFKVGNPSVRRLISGAVAGAVSRSAVAPLETIRTHMMVGSCGHSIVEVFENIMKNEGWKGLFRGNLVNVIRVAPSKAIELFAYDTVMKHFSPRPAEHPKLPIPTSSVAGAIAGISSTLCTYPLELLKTRLTVQRGVYKNLFHALVKIIQEEGPAELYRGLTPSLIGIIPYAAANYFAYDSLGKAYKRAFKKQKVGIAMTLLIGSAAGAISSTASFPLEVARKHMQAGALNGRQYQNMLHALMSILENEGLPGLYRGLGPSCMKLIPAAGISFTCYEACKSILIADEEES